MLESYKQKIAPLIGLSDRELFEVALDNHEDQEIIGAVLDLISDTRVRKLLKSKLSKPCEMDLKAECSAEIIKMLERKKTLSKSGIARFIKKKFKVRGFSDLRNECIDELLRTGKIERIGSMLSLIE